MTKKEPDELTGPERAAGFDRMQESAEAQRAAEAHVKADAGGVPASIDPKLLEQREATKKAERELKNRSSLKPPPIPW